MARIRSIKPGFWTDGNNLALSDSCALFYIGLWNFCDDEGKIRRNVVEISALMGGRWDRAKVDLFVTRLLKTGQVRISLDSGWLQVVHWSHQKIDKPKQPEVKAVDIQWVKESDSTNGIESSLPLGARIGWDRIGKDTLARAESETGTAPATAAAPTALDQIPLFGGSAGKKKKVLSPEKVAATEKNIERATWVDSVDWFQRLLWVRLGKRPSLYPKLDGKTRGMLNHKIDQLGDGDMKLGAAYLFLAADEMRCRYVEGNEDTYWLPTPENMVLGTKITMLLADLDEDEEAVANTLASIVDAKTTKEAWQHECVKTEAEQQWGNEQPKPVDDNLIQR